MRVFDKKFSDNMNIASFLRNPECKFLMNENRIFVHIESEYIFYGNENTRPSIYWFMFAQQSYEKKLFKL